MQVSARHSLGLSFVFHWFVCRLSPCVPHLIFVGTSGDFLFRGTGNLLFIKKA